MKISNRSLAHIAALVALLCASALAGCAMGSKKDDASAVDKRAVERWQLLIAHKAEKAYDYLSPGYQKTKDRVSYASAMNYRPIAWKGVKFVNKECDADRCTVHLSVDYSVKIGAGLGGPVDSTGMEEETWVRVKGTWYFLPST